MSGSPGSALLQVDLLNPGESDLSYTATDAYGGSVTRTVTLTITANVARSVAEGSSAGTAVGSPVTGTPYDDGDDETDDALAYTLTGSAMAKFAIDSATGQISVAEGATLDYENDDVDIQVETMEDGSVRKFYTGTVKYTVDGIAASIQLTIDLTDVDFLPEITVPEDKRYKRGETITAFDITVTDAENDEVTVTVTGLPSGLSYSDGKVSGTVADDADFKDYTVTISAKDPGNDAVTATFTITVYDNTPTGITLSANPSSLGEDDAATTVTVTATLNGGTRTEATVVTIGTLAGTATKDTDYTLTITPTDDSVVEGDEIIMVPGTTLASITIPANTASGSETLTITPTDDQIVEGDETITIPGTTTVTGLSVTSATVTLTDDDGTTSTPTDDKDSADLSITGPSANVAEGSDATFTVTLSAGVASQVQVAWTATGNTDDYSPDSGTVTFAAGSAAGATQTITITATDDALSETAESFTVTLGTITTTLPSAQVTLKSGASSATATIAASDPITVSISGPSNVDEGDATTAYTVSLSPSGVKPTADLTVSYGTSDGTATAGTDYTAASGTLTFTNAAAGSQTFTVSTTEDTSDESDETFTVTISSPSGGGGTTSLGTSTVTTTITDDDSLSGITLSASPSSLGEDDAATTVTVTATLSGGGTRTEATVVTIGTLSGTATKDTDYTATTLASITIPANATSGTGTLTITPTDDAIVEGDETITIPGTTTVSGLTVSSATITLTDDNKTTTTPTDDKDSAELSISGPASNVTEGSDATFTVTLSAAVSKEVTVAWSATGNTTDYSPTSGTVTFAAGSAAGATEDIEIAVTDDDLSETAESFTVTLGTVGGDLSSQVTVKSSANSATATISESDPITISISGPSNVDEGDTTTAYTVSLSPSGVTPTADLTVSYATSDGTATAGTDYTAASGTLTFTQVDHADKTFTVSTEEDTFDESDETFTVTISSPSGGGGPAPKLGTAKVVTTTIDDDDDAISGITLTVSPTSVGEDDAKTEFIVTASLGGSTTRPSDTVVTLTLGGTAGSSDYTVNTSLGSITIPANSTSASGTLELTPTDDAIVEGDETIVISGTTTVTGLTVSSATITLTDDDKSTTTPTDDKDSADLSITGPASNVAEGSDATFTVTLSAEVSKEVTVAWSAGGNTTDYSPTSGTVTFAAGSAAGATEDIEIAVTDDDLSETAESFTVTLGTVGGDLSSQVTVKSSANSATATIAESDPITISISGPSNVDEGDATTAYTVLLSPAGVTPTADLTVSYATSDGTATAGTDYTAKSGTLTFTQADHADKTFTVSTEEDTFDESDETFTVTISSPSGGGGPTPTIGTASVVTTTIDDDDAAISGITLSVNPSSVGEDDAKTEFTVTASLGGTTTRPSDTEVTLTLGGTAGSSDYTVNTSLASITIPANATSATGTLELTPTDDTVVEGDETIIISGTTTVSLSVSDATITLTDDDKSTSTPTDDKDSAELIISGPSANVSEGSDATFTVTLSAEVSKEVTVAWSAAGNTTDYSPTSGTVTFAAGSAAEATEDIEIAVTDDDLSETAESFTVTLGTVGGDLSSQVTVKGSANSATATISESDPITISISGPSNVDEGDATSNYTVSLSPSGVTPTADLTVSYATSDGTATAGSDYTAVSGTLTFTNAAAGSQTFTVSTEEDTFDESDETFTVTISSPSGGGGPTPTIGTESVVTTTIDDDDDAISGITLSVNPSSVGEDDAKTEFTVTASLGGSTTRPSDTEVTLTLGGTAGSSDYTVNTSLGSITIPANATSASGTLELTPTDDAIVEGDETIVISGTTTVSLSVSDATITLTDDDKSTSTPTDDKDSAELSISGPASNVSEGSDATFTVTLSKAIASRSGSTGGVVGSSGHRRGRGRGPVRHLRDGHLPGEQLRRRDAEHHDHRDGRRAVGDGRVVHRDAGYDHVAPVLADLPQERRILRPGNHRRERPDHGLHQRSVHSVRGRRHDRLHCLPVAVGRHAHGGPDGELRYVRRDGDGRY